MEREQTELHQEVARYYAEKLAIHGSTPRGVDWNNEESQSIRFEQLCKLFDINKREISVIDLGCGYGALIDYLRQINLEYTYLGVDIAAEMINVAQQRYNGNDNVRFITAAEPDENADYGVASGIFNVRLSRNDFEWYEYLKSTLDVLHRTSKHGFSFNCLSTYSDKSKRKDYLYYADPCDVFDLCKSRYTRNVALLHDYDLYEFTILVRKA